jgi:hypothetical protein
MTSLLRLIRDHPDALEADLSRYHNGMDLRDYWRTGPDGRRLLTLRQIAARVRYLPPDCATAQALGGSGWTTADYLLADVFHAQAGRPHPGRPKPGPRAEDPARARARASALARARAHRQAVAEGRIT